jgi:hypothetical protein
MGASREAPSFENKRPHYEAIFGRFPVELRLLELPVELHVVRDDTEGLPYAGGLIPRGSDRTKLAPLHVLKLDGPRLGGPNAA